MKSANCERQASSGIFQTGPLRLDATDKSRQDQIFMQGYRRSRQHHIPQYKTRASSFLSLTNKFVSIHVSIQIQRQTPQRPQISGKNADSWASQAVRSEENKAAYSHSASPMSRGARQSVNADCLNAAQCIHGWQLLLRASAQEYECIREKDGPFTEYSACFLAFCHAL